MITIVKSLIEDFIMIPSFNVVILGTQQTGKTVSKLYILEAIQPNKEFSQFVIIFNIVQLYIYTYSRIKQYIFPQKKPQILRQSKQGYVYGIWVERRRQGKYGKIITHNHMESSTFLIVSMNWLFNKVSLHQLLRHNEIARIPILILVNNIDTIDDVRKFIDEQPQLFNREFNVRVFQFEQIGMLSSPQNIMKKQQKSIQQIMTWLYKKISILQKQVKNYDNAQ